MTTKEELKCFYEIGQHIEAFLSSKDCRIGDGDYYEFDFYGEKLIFHYVSCGCHLEMYKLEKVFTLAELEAYIEKRRAKENE